MPQRISTEDADGRPGATEGPVGCLHSAAPKRTSRDGSYLGPDQGGRSETIQPIFIGGGPSPAEDWEKNAWYVPGLDFLSNDYLHGVTQADVTGWKQFFLAAGAKDAGEPTMSRPSRWLSSKRS